MVNFGVQPLYNAAVRITAEQYLHTSFEGCDCEYVDGEVVERNWGDKSHSRTQALVAKVLFDVEARLAVEVLTEIRIQINPRRYRVADVAVWRAGTANDRIPSTPPFLAVEILSPEDRMVRMQPKVQEYLSIGVQWVWVIDPEERKALCYSQTNPAGTLCDTLGTDDPPIEIPLAPLGL